MAPRGRRPRAGAGATRGQQRNTRANKKQRVEEAFEVDEEPSATYEQSTKQQPQRRPALPATGNKSTQKCSAGLDALTDDEIGARQGKSIDLDESDSDADCQMVNGPTLLENQRPVTHRQMKNKMLLASPFNSGDVYIALADDNTKRTYILNSKILSIISPWFKHTLDLRPIELDHDKYNDISRRCGIKVRYGLVHNDQFDIPVLKRIVSYSHHSRAITASKQRKNQCRLTNKVPDDVQRRNASSGGQQCTWWKTLHH
jgi:hypothetical protein